MGCPYRATILALIPEEMKPTRGKQSREGADSDPTAPCTFREFKPLSFPLLCLSQLELSFYHMQHKGSLNQYNECLVKNESKK